MSQGPVVAACAAGAGDMRATAPPTTIAASAGPARCRFASIEFLLELGVGPALVGGGGTGPEDHRSAVGRRVAVDVQAKARLGAADGAVGVDGPALVGTAVAVPDLDLAAGGGVERSVEALAEGLYDLAADRPPLVRASVAVPDDRLGAVGGVAVGHVEAASGRGTDEGGPDRRRCAAAAADPVDHGAVSGNRGADRAARGAG